jgi:hypothetical protein
MPIYQIAQYQVKSSAIEKVKRAIEEFVRYLQERELTDPGGRLRLFP